MRLPALSRPTLDRLTTWAFCLFVIGAVLLIYLRWPWILAG